MPEIRLKCASGLGDSIYIYPVLKEYLKKYDSRDITIMTNYPEIFQDLGVKTIRHTKDWASHKISYCPRKYDTSTTQFQDVLMASRLPTDIKLNIPWKVKEPDYINKLYQKMKIPFNYLVVAAPYVPFGRCDGFGKELTIKYQYLDDILRQLKKDYFVIQVGSEDSVYQLKNIDLNLCRKTTITQLMDLTSQASFVVGQVGHMIPIAEALNIPGMIVFSKNGLDCPNKFISSITPQKIIHKKNLLMHCTDNEYMKTVHKRIELWKQSRT